MCNSRSAYRTAMRCLTYIGDEAPRQFATKLQIATGEDFQLLRIEEVRVETDRDAQARPLASTGTNHNDKSAPVSLMITRAQRRALRKLGHSEKDVRNMTPAEA